MYCDKQKNSNSESITRLVKNMGKINLILGCMFSGKTSELLRRYKRYKIGGKKVIMIKYENDNRYSETCVTSHDGEKIKSHKCSKLKDVDSLVKKYNVVFVDEIQFFDDAIKYVEKWANSNLIVELTGLSGTFDRKPWPIISELVPKVEDIIYLQAICKTNGKNASFTKLKKKETNIKKINIGGSEKYEAVDRSEFFK